MILLLSLHIYPIWDSLGFLDLGDYFLPHFREVFNYYLLKYFLMVFLFVFFFWDSYDSNVGAFDIVSGIFEIVLIYFNSFFFFLSDSFISTILSSTSLILFSASIILLLVPSRVFLISFIALFSMYWLFFISSRSLLNFSWIFSIPVSRLFILTPFCFQGFGSLSLSLFEILYQVDFLFLPLLFGLVGIYPVPLPAGYFSASSRCLYCCVCGHLSVFW